MSCSIIALPFEVAFIVAHLVATNINQQTFNDNNNDINIDNNIDDVFYIKEDSCKEIHYETAFNSMDLLVKTLTEHGMTINYQSENKIEAKISNYTFTFDRENSFTPYNLNVQCSSEKDLENTLNNINQEYDINVQEKSYLSIVNNLKDNNMQIENEEVLDDDTVVLTINIE